MSLIPYHPREGREIVLRHRNAVVVRDPESQRLEIRGSECPTCHQPLGRAPSPERSFERSYEMNHEYVDPEYFRMLRTGNHQFPRGNGPPSPIRRLVEPALVNRSATRSASPQGPVPEQDDSHFMSSSPGAPKAEGSRIRKEAFSPNYFKSFFVEESVLGKGGKGVVLLVRHEIDGCPLGHFACKRVPVGDDHSWLEKVLVEVELLAKLSHPNLVSYRHVWLEDVQLTRFGPSVACAFILQQYCDGGDLHQYVVGSAPRELTKEELKAQMRRRSKGQAEAPQNSTKPQLTFEEIYSLFRDITSGVAYLHSANYIHRDLKPSNCLLHREGGKLTCLISDFGEVQPENAVRKSTGSTGTISYCAPEVLKTDVAGQYGNFTTKSDVFSLGMILYFMCFGRLPYQGANAIQEELEDIDQLRAEISDWQGFQGERQERPDLPSKLYKLLKKLLALDPAERPSANEVLLAMRSETNFDNITKGDRVASRVQNLDSPVPPGTPVLDPEKENSRGRKGSRKGNFAPGPPIPNPFESAEESTQTPRTNVFSTHDLRNHHHLEICQDKGREGFEAINGATALDTDSTEISTPRLLMAPPRTRAGEFIYQMSILSHRISSGLGITAELLNHLLRLAVFTLKLATLSRPCWPYILLSSWAGQPPLPMMIGGKEALVAELVLVPV
ncbi:protein kinase-like protein [Metarhizium rileyi]|uniref:non-specific serine/threonine protein kinase n=1 Tax=Metarhizium rileyi (strain RCEF 4871) TaxID=1649241 RepID=A0A167KRS4_METRR|nr:protein kinase-like protein [Metarhizium rileyi RCEF 4871]